MLIAQSRDEENSPARDHGAAGAEAAEDPREGPSEGLSKKRTMSRLQYTRSLCAPPRWRSFGEVWRRSPLPRRCTAECSSGPPGPWSTGSWSGSVPVSRGLTFRDTTAAGNRSTGCSSLAGGQSLEAAPAGGPSRSRSGRADRLVDGGVESTSCRAQVPSLVGGRSRRKGQRPGTTAPMRRRGGLTTSAATWRAVPAAIATTCEDVASDTRSRTEGPAGQPPPQRQHGGRPAGFERDRYRRRNEVERTVDQLKNFPSGRDPLRKARVHLPRHRPRGSNPLMAPPMIRWTVP